MTSQEQLGAMGKALLTDVLEDFTRELVERLERREGITWRRWATNLARALEDTTKSPAERVELAVTLLEVSAQYGPTGELDNDPGRYVSMLEVCDAAHCFVRRAEHEAAELGVPFSGDLQACHARLREALFRLHMWPDRRPEVPAPAPWDNPPLPDELAVFVEELESAVEYIRTERPAPSVVLEYLRLRGWTPPSSSGEATP